MTDRLNDEPALEMSNVLVKVRTMSPLFLHFDNNRSMPLFVILPRRHSDPA